MSTDLIRVALVDDQHLVRQGLSYIINAQEDMEVVGEAGNGLEAVELAKLTRPHVLLMDVQMPEYSGIEATRDIMAALPDSRVVILTTFDTEEYVYDGIRYGAVGYLLKDAAPADLVDAVRSAYRGEAVFRTSAAAKMMTQALRAEDLKPTAASAAAAGFPVVEQLEAFTERELEVLQQMAYGLRNEEIAGRLFIGVSTVKTHVHRILQKIGVDDRTQAVVYAIRNGIVR
ncbi:response regulator [Paenibacillus tuaregi]|uniref:response regulator n=1 Tax=Paenibacillus tuaregi TaxID=1816681 RepID=UPI00083955D5|nr:response regulator transcription factor [Paenibacillus tuaregi]